MQEVSPLTLVHVLVANTLLNSICSVKGIQKAAGNRNEIMSVKPGQKVHTLCRKKLYKPTPDIAEAQTNL